MIIWKEGAEGKKVLIQVFAKDDIATVSVTNYGYVIPAEKTAVDLQQVLPQRAVEVLKDRRNGSWSCHRKEYRDMHGGTISVASDLNGTVFTVKLKVDFDE